MVRDQGKNRCIPANIRDTAIFSFPNCQKQDFTTLFKKETAIKPSEYRRLYQQDIMHEE